MLILAPLTRVNYAFGVVFRVYRKEFSIAGIYVFRDEMVILRDKRGTKAVPRFNHKDHDPRQMRRCGASRRWHENQGYAR